LELLDRKFDDGRLHDGRVESVVNEDVDTAPSRGDLLDRSFDLIGVADVGRYTQCRFARGLDVGHDGLNVGGCKR